SRLSSDLILYCLSYALFQFSSCQDAEICLPKTKPSFIGWLRKVPPENFQCVSSMAPFIIMIRTMDCMYPLRPASLLVGVTVVLFMWWETIIKRCQIDLIFGFSPFGKINCITGALIYPTIKSWLCLKRA